MSTTGASTEAKVKTLAETVVSRSGYELVDVEYRREPEGWKVRLFIDRPGGVTLSDCEKISHEFGTILEVEDPIPHRYTLEVSSPGLDRPLKKEADFLGAVGLRVRLTTREPMNGQRHFTGRLLAAAAPEGGDGLALTIQDDTTGERVVPVVLLERARVVHQWPDSPKPGGGSKRRKSGSGRTS